ncbi:hypothetical protein L484_015009 [Morus notabilis]|uniref:Uncharacterized protein n=1 Tax=Morus notabilis TaxID=981085 RepID=W9RMU9_9ROSA|nr:hypothetical protein L484_015009 [Morus notabilis]
MPPPQGQRRGKFGPNRVVLKRVQIVPADPATFASSTPAFSVSECIPRANIVCVLAVGNGTGMENAFPMENLWSHLFLSGDGDKVGIVLGARDRGCEIVSSPHPAFCQGEHES